MAIAYPLAFPSSPAPAEGGVSMTVAEAVVESPFSLRRQVQSWGAGKWKAVWQMPPMRAADARRWTAFLAALNGQAGTFRAKPFLAPNGGKYGGAPLVAGGNQRGMELRIDNAARNVTKWAAAGDYIQTGAGGAARLYIVTADAASSSAGAVTLDVWPSLMRAPPADKAAVTVSGASGVWRLTAPPAWTVDHLGIYSIGIEAVEAV